MVRVRFAPSPTGYLHIGGARTALFNWLFARHHRGKFILRIEDTDTKRSSEESIKAIIDGLKWLGLNWDEGPYYQSQRLSIYQEYAERLINEGQAYRCYCTPEILEEKRQRMLAQKKNLVYDGTCRELTPEERKRYEDCNRPYAIRFKVWEGVTVMKDLIRGERRFDNSIIGDFIIVKSDGRPSYNFACVVDDITMKITHVIRGDDHISNTPRQLLLYQAIGVEPPQFAHLPMIWGPDRTRLSKRHGATSLDEYRREGYLAPALVNYLALLGWGTPDSQQIFRLEEMISKFSLDRVSKNPAIFDPEKLAWMNSQYIIKEDVEQLIEHLKPYLVKYQTQIETRSENWLKDLVKLYQIRMKTFKKFIEDIDFFFTEEVHLDEEALKILSQPGITDILKKIRDRLVVIDPFEPEIVEREIRILAEELRLKAGDVIHPLRAVVTGRKTSPPIFDILVLLGKEVVLSRLDKALQGIEKDLSLADLGPIKK